MSRITMAEARALLHVDDANWHRQQEQILFGKQEEWYLETVKRMSREVGNGIVDYIFFSKEVEKIKDSDFDKFNTLSKKFRKFICDILKNRFDVLNWSPSTRSLDDPDQLRYVSYKSPTSGKNLDIVFHHHTNSRVAPRYLTPHDKEEIQILINDLKYFYEEETRLNNEVQRRGLIK